MKEATSEYVDSRRSFALRVEELFDLRLVFISGEHADTISSQPFSKRHSSLNRYEHCIIPLLRYLIIG